MLNGARIVAEFGLGRLLSATPLAAGHPDVIALVTTRGTFVVKPASGPAWASLQEQAALALAAAGLRQAPPLRTIAGELVSSSGHTVQEFLPGAPAPRPTPAQTVATMRQVGRYHAALEHLPVPAALLAQDTLWTRVASAEYLVAELPGLLRRHGLAGGAGHQLVAAALRHLELALPRLAQLPRQLVHGDIGPDNVLMDGDDVLAIIDFTPHWQPVLFAVASAVYWYQVYGQGHLDPARIRASLAAAAGQPWTTAEQELWPAMLAGEGLRRLATFLAIADQAGAQPPAATSIRYRAVAAIMNSWPLLSGPS